MRKNKTKGYLFFRSANSNSRSSLLITLVIILSSTTLVKSAFNDQGDDDESAINVRTYEDFKVNKEIEDNCDLRVMRAYSMYGDSSSLSQRNEVFPAIKQNCCGVKDQANIKALWRRAANQIVKNQKYFLYLAKGILTQSQDFLRLASHGHLINDRINNKKFTLESVRKDYPGLTYEGGELVWHHKNYKVLINKKFLELALPVKDGMDTSKLKIMYHNFNQAAEFMMNIRRTFFGMICSVEGQLASNRRGFFKRVFYPDDIFYATPFCDAMVSHHFRYFYDYYYFFKRLQKFVDHLPFFVQETTEFVDGSNNVLSNIGNRGSGNSNESDYLRKGVIVTYGRFSYDTPSWKEFTNRYFLGTPNMIDTFSIQACSNYGSFSACELYCQEFSIVKNTDRFDGDPNLLLRTFRTMMAMRDQFIGFKENEFEVDLISLEKMIDELKEKFNEYIYISSMPHNIEFNEKGNDFSELAGFNPFEMSVSCTLDLTFQSVKIFSMLNVVVTVVFWLFCKD